MASIASPLPQPALLPLNANPGTHPAIAGRWIAVNSAVSQTVVLYPDAHGISLTSQLRRTHASIASCLLGFSGIGRRTNGGISTVPVVSSYPGLEMIDPSRPTYGHSATVNRGRNPEYSL